MLWPPWVILVGTSKVFVISYAWMHPAPQGDMTLSVQWRKSPSHKSLLCWWVFPLKIYTPITFSSENRYLDCIVIAKSFIDLVEGSMALFSMGRCSYCLFKVKSKRNSLWNDQARQYKSHNKHFRRYRCWSTRVIYSGCRDVDCNSKLYLYYTCHI